MPTRTRTITWHDPAEAAALVGGLSGLEILHRIASGLVPPPPAAELVGFRPTYVMPGRVVFAYEPREDGGLGRVVPGDGAGARAHVVSSRWRGRVVGCISKRTLDEWVSKCNYVAS